MQKSISILNTESISRADVRIAPGGFRYGFIANFIQEEKYEILRHEFPDVNNFKLVDKMSGGGRKRFYVGPMYIAGKDDNCACAMRGLSEHWNEFMKECTSPIAIELLARHTGVAFNSLANFGLTYGSASCVQEPHIDGAVREYDESPVHSKWATIVYFNESPNNEAGTCVYLPDRTTVLFRAPSMRNGLFFFEQHPLAWHGFPEMKEGSERRILSLAYSNEATPILPKTSFFHQMSCKRNWKGIFGR